MDKFVKKRKKSESSEPENKEEKDKNKEEKSPLKQKKNIPMEVEDKPKVTPNSIIIDDESNLKFYKSYESFISKLETWQTPLKSFINPPAKKFNI